MADQPSDGKPKFDPFRPAEPRLPGVPERKAAPQPPPSEPAVPPPVESEASATPGPAWMQKLPRQLRALPRAALYGGAGAITLMVLVLLWSAFGSTETSTPIPVSASASATSGSQAATSSDAQPVEPPRVISLPGAVASVEELADPWASRKFMIRQAGTRRPAMVVRLPNASSGDSSGYWAFLLQSAYGKCELELVADLHKLAADYGDQAGHPMVVDPCTRTVFDPLRLDSIGAGIYARGEVVQGTAIRPPLAVEIRIEDGQIIALRTE